MTNQVQAITPQEISKLKGEIFPPAVLEAFNEQIAKNYINKNQSVTVYQDDVIDAIIVKQIGPPSAFDDTYESRAKAARNEIFNEKWLNVEEVYRAAGWEVVYNKPAYNETGKAFFRFKVNS